MWDATGGWSIGWIGLGLVHMILFWGFVVFVIVALVRLLSSDTRDGGEAGKDPLAILKERYARGEIDDEEFARAKRRLME